MTEKQKIFKGRHDMHRIILYVFFITINTHILLIKNNKTYISNEGYK